MPLESVMQRYFLYPPFMWCSLSAYAQEAKTDKNGVIEKPVLADTPDKFAAQTQRIHEDMQTGGRYEFTIPIDKKRVDALLGQMVSLLQAAGSVEAMNHDTRIT